MISNIASFLFGASEQYSSDLVSPCNLRTTNTEDEWVLVDQQCCGSPAVEVNPLDNLLIEHASMSVYGTLPGVRTAQPEEPSETSSVGSEVVAAAGRSAARACLSNRSEPYNLRKTTMHKAKKLKKETTKRAFHRNNQTTHFRQRSKRSVVTPIMVFQPRK